MILIEHPLRYISRKPKENITSIFGFPKSGDFKKVNEAEDWVFLYSLEELFPAMMTSYIACKNKIKTSALSYVSEGIYKIDTFED